jgi:hypothetical protein
VPGDWPAVQVDEVDGLLISPELDYRVVSQGEGGQQGDLREDSVGCRMLCRLLLLSDYNL